MLTGGFASEKKISITGNWELVYGYWTSQDLSFPSQITGNSLMTWTMDHFSSITHFRINSAVIHEYGEGTYWLKGNLYEEKGVFHRSKGPLIPLTYDFNRIINRMQIEFQNDTLIRRWPLDESGKLSERHNIEKYTRQKGAIYLQTNR